MPVRGARKMQEPSGAFLPSPQTEGPWYPPVLLSPRAPGHESCRNTGCAPRWLARKGILMRRRFAPLLGVLAAAVLAIACGTSSDAGITTKVKSRLETDRTVDAAKVEVTTQNKVVTLSGAVGSPESRTQAVAL